ncbi:MULTISPECIES: IS66 family transposase zinc-finger binding domain-containing protein [Cupriavidus]|uniref:IS66 family transposase zinc-finger binding domain-containing protein n=1 Tax=Cupriavidus sp. U2 TaxID=2920269 RepID=UPI0012FE232F|nr:MULTISPECIES: IS66 family transposase zinc-finger binding domain-containing protein [Cupriavidus]
MEREDLIHTPAGTTCCACRGASEILAEGKSEPLEPVRARLRIIRHRRVKLACTGCNHHAGSRTPVRVDRFDGAGRPPAGPWSAGQNAREPRYLGSGGGSPR